MSGKFVLCLRIFALLIPLLSCPALYAAQANFNLTRQNPIQGNLNLPLLDIDGRTTHQNITLSLDFSSQAWSLLQLENGPGTVSTGGNSVLTLNTDKQGILSIPFLSLNTLPGYRAVNLFLDFNNNRFELRSLAPLPVMLGAYTAGYIGSADTVQNELVQFDQWAGQRLTFGGLFMGMESDNPAFNIPAVLNLMEQNGYIALFNLSTSSRTAADIANGAIDSALQSMAQAFAAWLAQHPQRTALIAPMPEMNGAWEKYGHDPANFKRAYIHIQNIFKQAGANKLRWVFAPNGWSESGHEFENYYPGDEHVSVVGFSAYNWGYCSNAASKQWQSPQQVFGPYIPRMRAMAPSKPLFITQTASTSVSTNGNDTGAKDQWLKDSYRYLAQAGVQAVFHFNIDKECDWQVYRQNGNNANGYREVTGDNAFGYLPPEDLFYAIP